MNFSIPRIGIFLLVLCSFVGCKQHAEARRPLSHASGTFMKKSAARNKKLVATEESQIAELIKSNPSATFIASNKGYWYSYLTQNKADTLSPKKGDITYFTYEIKDLKGNVIYTEEELKPQTYAIDKQEILIGLRDGIKLLHKKEKAVFLFPSHMAYGYHGDNKKIGVNQPIQCIVNFIDFKPENQKRSASKSIKNTENTSNSIKKEKDTLTN